jgi:Uma2 family endonuclease
MTAEDLLRLPDDGMRHELIAGELITMPPPGGLHEEVAGLFLLSVGPFVKARRLGKVLGAPGIYISHDPDTVRAPDFAWVAAGRLPGERSPEGYIDLAPDLVVEVTSPSDSATEVQAKIATWLEIGVRMVIQAYPRTRSLAIYRSASDIRLLGPSDVFDGGDVLPGFSCAVSDFFPD